MIHKGQVDQETGRPYPCMLSRHVTEHIDLEMSLHFDSDIPYVVVTEYDKETPRNKIDRMSFTMNLLTDAADGIKKEFIQDALEFYFKADK